MTRSLRDQSSRSSRPAPRAARLRPLLALAAGVVLAGVLAAVLFGSGGPGAQGATVAPGIDQSTGSVLSLDVLPGGAPSAAAPFVLTDQRGNRVSLAQFRGKAVVLSFNDDRCPDLCTLLAQAIVVAQHDLGTASRRVAFVSVNVNPFYPQVRSVKQWTDDHDLGRVADWYFTTGPVPTLESIWHAYGVGVQTDPSTQTVVHGSELFFIDPHGDMRAVGAFGMKAADTQYFAHAMSQMAVDLLPASGRPQVGGPATPPASSGNISPGAPAPAFDLPSLGAAGQRISLAALRGRPTVVNFWSSTCVPCRAELPALEAARRDLGDKVNFVGVDVADNASAARVLAARSHVTYPLASDRAGRTAGAYAVSGTPYTVIVGPHGTIETVHPGTFTTEQVEYVLRSFDPSLASGG